MILQQQTHIPFDEWVDQLQVELESFFGSLAQIELRSLLFASFEFGAKIGAEKSDDPSK